MANDRLINHTQGEAIIAQLAAINATLVRIAVALEPEEEEEEPGDGQSGGE